MRTATSIRFSRGLVSTSSAAALSLILTMGIAQSALATSVDVAPTASEATQSPSATPSATAATLAPAARFAVEDGQDLNALKKLGFDVSEVPSRRGTNGPVADLAGYTTMGQNCGNVILCGIVHNRTNSKLSLRRDSNSEWGCSGPSAFRSLPPGKDSNNYGKPTWEDVDCFAPTVGTIFYRGQFKGPYDYWRIYNQVWIY